VRHSFSEQEPLQKLFRVLAPAAFFQNLNQEFQCSRRGIYTAQLVIWLMMWQHLFGEGTLVEAVAQVVKGQPSSLLTNHKRIREGTVSSYTGAYSQSRKRLPIKMLRQVNQRLFDETTKLHNDTQDGGGIYLLDGSGLTLPHTPALVREFPPARNQHGVSHWPVMRIVVAHHLRSGAAVEPCYGPMFGNKAVSEQALAEQLLPQLPPRSTIVADRNFGVFSVAFAAHHHQHDVIVRLTKARAKRLMGGTLPRRQKECDVEWKPSRDDRRAHPSLPADACLSGRLILHHIKRHRQTIVLYLFTTLQLSAEKIVELYGHRWNIETDLRTLKQEVRLGYLRSQTPQMVTKEIITGIMAYNLVRAVQMTAAQLAGVDARDLSFSKVQAVVNQWLPMLLDMRNANDQLHIFSRMVKAATQAKLPNRRRKRSRKYPRAIWGRPQEWARRTTGKKSIRLKGGK
jgi:hypothetical protein